jgi:CRP-like cAMP-binding protein
MVYRPSQGLQKESMDFNVNTIFGAVSMALLAMMSLIVGVLFGLYAKPSRRVNAIIMAFGTGALIQALSLELAYEGAERLVQHAGLGGVSSWMWVAAGFIMGGSTYYLGNQVLERRGAALRHPAMAKLFLLNKKREESAVILTRLSKIELVRSLPPEEMEDILLCVQPVQVKNGEVVFHRGDKGDALYFIDDGRIDIFLPHGDTGGSVAPLAQLGPGQSFGEMALLAREPRLASAIAAADSSLLKIDKEHFDELLDRSPRLRRAVEGLNSQRLLQNVEATRGKMEADVWQKAAVANIHRLTKGEEESMMKTQAAAGVPLAIFLGALLDGIPESVVIGSSFVTFESFRFTFLAAVFLSNLPEAIASAVGMKEAGFSQLRIFSLWGSLVVAGGMAAAFGNIVLADAPPTVLTLVGAVAGGGILAMVSSVMMPEAYEDGGPSVGLATIAGFLFAFLFMFL